MLEEQISSKEKEIQKLQVEIDQAQNALDACLDGDDDDDVNYRYKVKMAENNLQKLQIENTRETELLAVLKEKWNDIVKLHSTSSYIHCTKEMAVDFLLVFRLSSFQSKIMKLTDDLEMKDIHQYYTFLYRATESRISHLNAKSITANSEGGSQEMQSTSKISNGAGDRKLSRNVKAHDYFTSLQHPSIQSIVTAFVLSTSEIGDILRGRVSPKLHTPSLSVEDFMNEYVMADNIHFNSADKLWSLISTHIAMELSLEPTLKSLSRQIFYDYCYLNVVPTQKGIEIITPFHELFGLHLIDKKPIRDLLVPTTAFNGELYGRLMKAQREGLVTILVCFPTLSTEIAIPDVGIFYRALNLREIYTVTVDNDQEEGVMLKGWNERRLMILNDCFTKYIIPSLLAETKRELLRISNEYITNDVVAKFRDMLSIGPYQPKNMKTADILKKCHKNINVFSVVSIYIDNIDKRDTVLYVSYLDAEGLNRSHITIPHDIKNQKFEKIKQFIKSTQPNVIVINSSG